jgi:hypothetical protein
VSKDAAATRCCGLALRHIRSFLRIYRPKASNIVISGGNLPWDPATPEAQLIADRVGFLEAIRETVCGFRTISSPYSTPLLIVKNANSRTGRDYKPRSDLLTPYAGYKRCELHTLLLDIDETLAEAAKSYRHLSGDTLHGVVF